MAKLVSKVYGDALFEAARDCGKMDEIFEEVQSIGVILEENAELQKILGNPRVMREDKEQMIETIFRGRVSNEIVELMKLMIEKGRYSKIDSVFEYFIGLVKEEKKIGIAYIATAVELSEAQKEAVMQRLLQTTKYESFEMNYQVDASLIGGMVIRIGDRVASDLSWQTYFAHRNSRNGNTFHADIRIGYIRRVKMEAYLDNSATTRCCEEAAQLVVKLLTEDYGNPSSLHNKGVIAENYMNDARKKIAKTLKVQEKEICFTSGGTESNNLAIIGVAEANKRSGKHVITTSIEHPSVSATMAYLEEHGYEVTYLPVDAYGVISLDDLKAAIRPDTILVSLMQVNNEIGAVEPIAEAGALIKQCNPQTLFHVDAIQSYGKMRIYPAKMHVDLLSVSGHKIHGPKGSGFLYIKDKTKIHPLLNGGGQQRGMRSGTENVPAIAGLGVAAERIYTGFEEKIDRMYTLREHFIEEVTKIPGVHVNGHTDRSNAPHIVSVSTEGVRAEVLLHALEDKEIYVSAGSACSSNKPSVSHTLKSIGLKPELLDATIRFSFCVETTEEEIDYAVKEMAALVPMLQKYTRH